MDENDGLDAAERVEMLDTPIIVRHNVDLATIDIVAAGPWTWKLRTDLMTAVRKALVQQPRAVLLDLAGLVDAESTIASAVLLAEAQSAARNPPVPLVVAVNESQKLRLHSTGVATRIPAHVKSAASASPATETTPPLQHARLRLQPTVFAAVEARNFVGDTCSAWTLTNWLHPARLIVSELTTNAVEHAQTPFTVTLTLRGPTLMHMAVEDGSPQLPQVRTWSGSHTAPLALRGNGMRIVAATAAAWGSSRTTNGKVVWATLYDLQR